MAWAELAQAAEMVKLVPRILDTVAKEADAVLTHV